MSDCKPEFEHNVYLDAKGLNCPLPVLKAKLELNKMKPGEILFVEATDPHATVDFHAYCARAGHDILKTDKSSEVITFYIKCKVDREAAN